MSTGKSRGPGRRQLRKARKLARERQQAWDEIRANQELDRRSHPTPPTRQRPALTPDGPHHPVTTGSPVVAPDATPAMTPVMAPVMRDLPGRATNRPVAERGGRLANLLGVVHPVVLAVVVLLTAVAGTPLITGTWRAPWAAAGVVTGVVLLGAYPRTWRRARSRERATGAGLALLLVAAAIVGAIDQNVVDGRAQLRGSDIDRAVEQHRGLVAAAKIMRESQGLLTLPPEQAIPLGGVYAEARLQAIAIGERWNPATMDRAPLPELVDAYVLVNRAAAQQAAALGAFTANLENPDAALAAEYVQRGLAVDDLLAREVPAALERVESAIRNAVAGGEEKRP